MDHFGTPLMTYNQADTLPFKTTLCWRPFNHSHIHNHNPNPNPRSCSATVFPYLYSVFYPCPLWRP